MKRIAEQNMLNWIDLPRRKPLIIRGARQVGKTWLVENCLAKRFGSFIKIDLEKQPQLHAAFMGDLSPRKVLDSIEAYTGRILPVSRPADQIHPTLPTCYWRNKSQGV